MSDTYQLTRGGVTRTVRVVNGACGQGDVVEDEYGELWFRPAWMQDPRAIDDIARRIAARMVPVNTATLMHGWWGAHCTTEATSG